jgi:hypothetical protein
MRGLVVVALALALLADVRSAAACQADRSETPTNVNLVARTRRIIVGKVINPTEDGGVDLEVTTVIRGSLAKGDHVKVRGYVVRGHRGLRPDPFDFKQLGQCFESEYIRGASYVLMLDEYEDTGLVWDTMRLPFARVNIRVEPTGDPWLTAVIEYARITDLKKPDQVRAELAKLVARGKAPKATKADVVIANDVSDHLGAGERGPD